MLLSARIIWVKLARSKVKYIFNSHRIPLLVLAVLCWSAEGYAAVLDWGTGTPNYTWTAGAPGSNSSVSQSFDNDATHAGNDLTITLANVSAVWSTTANAPTPGYNFPIVNSYTTGGTTNKDALQLRVNSEGSTTQGITVTISFTYGSAYLGVNNLSFTLFDVDASSGQYKDTIKNITATTYTGAIVGPSSVTGSADNTVTGSGTNYAVTGNTTSVNTTGNANATINFGSNIVTSITFTWYNTDSGTSLGAQVIGLGNISYTPVPTPEIGSSLAALAVCGIAIGARRMRGRFRPARRS